MTRSSTLNVHRANSQAISSYPVIFSTDAAFFSLVSFTFCLLFLKLKIYLFYTHSTMGVVELIKNFSLVRISETMLFFWPNMSASFNVTI